MPPPRLTTIEDNAITDNSGAWGIYYYDAPAAPVISGNTITENFRSMIIPASSLPNSADGNTLAPNSVNGVWIRGNARATDLRLEMLYAGEEHELSTYQIYDTMTMNSGVTLTVDPGVVVKFYSGAGLTINGGLDAQGTSDFPVVFTSYKDDQYGGDLNLDGYDTTPVNGDWRGIYFTNQADDGACVIDNAVIRYGGSANSGMIYAYQTNFPITNSVISNSSTNGIRSYQSSLTLANNEVFSNIGDGLYLESSGTHTMTGMRIFANFGDGIEVRNSVSSAVTDSEIFGNTGYGIRNSTGVTIPARDNWWGAVDGPGGSGTGSGDEVNAYVDYGSHLTTGTEFSYFDAGGTGHYGYNISQPTVSGIPSDEWGTNPTQTFLYNMDEGLITAEYADLSASSTYRLFVTYLNQDDGGGIQNLTDINNKIIHPSWVLPTSNPVQYDFFIAPDSIVGGNLRLNFNGLSGLRTVVSGIFLIKEISTDSTPPVIHLNTPVNGDILRTEEHFISGTVSDADSGVWAVEAGIQKTGEDLNWYPVTSVNSTGTWAYQWNNPSSGEYTLMARAADQSGNLAIALEVAVVTIDGLAPSPVTGLFVQGLSGVSDTMRLTWALSTDDGSGASDVAGYETYRSEGAFLDYTLVGQAAPGISQFDDTPVAGGTDYFYYVSAVDHAGNGSDSTVFGPVQSTGASDITPPEDVASLTAYATQVSGGNPSVFLTWAGSADTAGDLVDQLLYVSTTSGITSFGNNNPDYDNGLAYSLGREARSYQEISLASGQAYTFRITTVDEVPNESSGTTVTVTPAGIETEVITLGGTLSTDTHLKSGVYVISTDLTIPVGVTLTIEPGVIVKFAQNRSMLVYGTLTAVGSSGNEVVFTSFTDDDFGGDSNGGGPI